MESREIDLNTINKAVLKTYQEKMHEYLNSKPPGALTDSDVIMMIMNVTVNVSTNIYYSLKQILPTTVMDFDFIRAKLSNSLVDSFDKIKEFTPKESVMPLTVEQIKEIQEKGSAIIKMNDGTERRVTKDDLLVKRDDADKILKDVKKETLHAPGAKKIITKSNGAFRR